MGKTGPSLPIVCSFLLTCPAQIVCHPLGLGGEDFAARIAVPNFGYGGCTPPFALDGFALSLSSLSARCGLSFCFVSCLHPAFYAFANSTIKNGNFKRLFSASNCAIRCHDLLRMSKPCPFFIGVFTIVLLFPSPCKLDTQKWRFQLPYSASNCVIRCHSLLESPSNKGFLPSMPMLELDGWRLCLSTSLAEF